MISKKKYLISLLLYFGPRKSIQFRKWYPKPAFGTPRAFFFCFFYGYSMISETEKKGLGLKDAFAITNLLKKVSSVHWPYE